MYYHATVDLHTQVPVFYGLHLITPFWGPFRLLPSLAIEKYSDWTVRAYRWRIQDGKKSWAIIKYDISNFLEWALTEDLQYALELSFRSRSFFINCNWGASERRPGGQGRYDAREDAVEEMAIYFANRITVSLETTARKPKES